MTPANLDFNDSINRLNAGVDYEIIKSSEAY